MKTFLKGIIILCVALISQNISAQNPERGLRERILNAKFDEICRRMELKTSEADKLRPVFKSFEKEKAALMLNDRGDEFAMPDSSLTEQQQDEIYLRRLEKAKKLVELRENYYPKFRTALTPKQVVQFNRVEMEVNRRMLLQMRKRINERNQLRK